MAALAAWQGPDERVGALDGERFAQGLLHVPQAVRAVGGFLLQRIQHIDIKRRVSHGKDTENAVPRVSRNKAVDRCSEEVRIPRLDQPAFPADWMAVTAMV